VQHLPWDGCKGQRRIRSSQALEVAPPDLRASQEKWGVFPAERISGVIDGTVEITSHGPRDMPIRGMRYSVDAASVLLLVEYPSRIQQKSSSREPDTMHPCNPPQAKRY
jgi:hypothetical protein